MPRTLLLLLALVVVAGCGAEAAEQPAPVIELPVLVGDQAAPYTLVVPVPDGWEPIVEAGQPIAAITHPFGRDCTLFIQVVAEGSDARPEVPPIQGLRDVEDGTRTVERFNVSFKFGEARRGLAFSGGATGPGGLAHVLFQPATGRPPWIALTVQGGTEGPGCLARDDLDRAPPLVVDALRPIARTATVRYTP